MTTSLDPNQLDAPCQHCGTALRFNRDRMGQRIPCPTCDRMTTLELPPRKGSRYLLVRLALTLPAFAMSLYGLGTFLLSETVQQQTVAAILFGFGLLILAVMLVADCLIDATKFHRG